MMLTIVMLFGFSAGASAFNSSVTYSSESGKYTAIKKVWNIINGILECSKYTVTADRGFDLYVSEDGVNFNTITTNGFGDLYNHGLRVFANMDSGLMIGTANPFYSTQIWMLEEDETITETATPATGTFQLLIEKLVRFFNSIIEMIKENFAMIFSK